MKKLTFIILLTLFFILNWLMDIYNNFHGSNGFWDNLFGLDINQSFHVVWYGSMVVFLVMAYFVPLKE